MKIIIHKSGSKYNFVQCSPFDILSFKIFIFSTLYLYNFYIVLDTSVSQEIVYCVGSLLYSIFTGDMSAI